MQLSADHSQIQSELETIVPSVGAIGVAVSGGSDSMALLVALTDLCKSRGQRLEAMTVDHGLRPEAVKEAEAVRKLCGALNVPHASARWTGWNGEGNLQDSARKARYRLLAEWAQRRDISAVAIGHTKDDVAETFLMRIGRESGVDGLARMAETFTWNNNQFFRPFLNLSRQSLRAFLKARDIAWMEDSSNDNEDFERVRIRRALAVLSDAGIPSDAFAAVSENLAQVQPVLNEATLEFANRLLLDDPSDVVLRRPLFLEGHGELRRRLLISALSWAGGTAYGPRRAPLKELDQAIAEGKSFALNGCLIRVHSQTVRILREYNVVREVVEFAPSWDRWLINGPWQMGMRVAALGEPALAGLEDWRGSGVSRQSLMASPAVYQGENLIAVPLAGHGEGWSLQFKASNFRSYLANKAQTH